MSYTNETTHYNIPLPLASDLTTPMDYNTAMQAVDTALFGAVTDATAGVEKANAVEEALGTTNDNVSALAGRVTTAEGTIVTQGNAITQLQLDVADTKADALDMICAVDEGTAQVATVAVQEGKYFRYNDVLYMATADIAIGDTIVPNTNCRATNVASELEAIDIVDLTPRVEALEDTVESLQKSELNATGVSLTSGVEFTAPSDGIISFEVGAGAVGQVIGTMTGGNTVRLKVIRNSAELSEYDSINVRAGQKVTVTNALATFHAFV